MCFQDDQLCPAKHLLQLYCSLSTCYTLLMPGSQHLGIWSFWIDCKHAVIQKTTEILSVVCVQAMEAGQSRSGPLLRRPVRTQAVVNQSDMYTHVLLVFTEKKAKEARQPSLGLGFPRQ